MLTADAVNTENPHGQLLITLQKLEQRIWTMLLQDLKDFNGK